MNRLITMILLAAVLASCQSSGKHAASAQAAAAPRGLKPVYFEVNQSQVTDHAAIRQNAAWLNANRNQVVVLEGHCDERGSDEFNLHLGDLRARSVMKALMEQGVPESQLIIVSYGKKRPLVETRSNEGWAKNRRVELVAR